MAAGEMKVYGRNACLALWQHRAFDIVRVYVTEGRLKEFAPLLKWCATQRKAYHVIGPDELAKVAASVHHEGVMFLAKEPRRLGEHELAEAVARLPAGPTRLMYLDGVGNPHNIGSLTRLAAHFGVPLMLGRASELPRPTPAGTRIAEGGVEHVTTVELASVGPALAELRRAGFAVVTTSSHAEASLYAAELPPRALFVFGHETGGASAELVRAADHVLRVPGTGLVESLNVAVAAGLVLGEHWRRFS